MNPNDEIRRQILQYFYDRNSHATSLKGKQGSAAKISDVKRDLKARYGLSQQQVVSNLTYLLSSGWITEEQVARTQSVATGTRWSPQTFYAITAEGIRKIEGESVFEPPPRYGGINVHATGSNVITVGDGNIVRAEYRPLYDALNALKRAVEDESSLSDDQKLDVAVDIETLKDQLAKSEPDRTIAERVWNRIHQMASVGSLAQAIAQVGTMVTPLLT